MTEYKSRRGDRDYLSGERERTLASGIRRRSNAIGQFTLQRAFEELGCSCHSYRDKLKELEQQYKTEEQRLKESLYNSDLGREVRELKNQIGEIDRQEHPKLDADARTAYHFLPVWLMDEVRQGNPSVLELEDKNIADAYATAWYRGWRPRSLREQKPESEGQAQSGV